MKFLLLAISLGVWVSAAPAQAEVRFSDFQHEEILGYISAVQFKNSTLSHNLLYGSTKLDARLSDWTFSAALRFSGELGVAPNKSPNGEVEIRSLNLGYAQGDYKLTFGFQEIPWGETFGFYIADLVNPKDLRDPILNELGWIRVPVFALNAQYFLDKTTFQFILTPVPRNPRVPLRGSNFDIFPEGIPSQDLRSFDLSRMDEEAEWGGRVSQLFSSGLDLGLMYFQHWNRTPVYELISGSQIAPAQVRVNTLALTASQALNQWVIRMDSIATLGQPIPDINLGAPRRVLDWQTIVGTDYSPSDSWTFGAQYHKEWANPEFWHWGSFRVAYKWAEGRWATEMFVFAGLNNSDGWLQRKLIWNVSRRLVVSLSLDVLGYSISKRPGILTSFLNADRVLGWVTYHF
ncbi:hypothetical protein K2X30_06035 [bacterium]|jgi:hypothetical protein|nr:hypothetical protein [bacterium]